MCSTAPCGILATFTGVHPALKCTPTFCTPDKSGKRITVLIFVYAFLNVFLRCTLFQKHCNSVKSFSVDDCFMVLLHTIHIHFTRVPVPDELFIRKGLLEQGIPYIPFIGQQEVEVQGSHRWAGMPSSFRSAAIVPAPLPASTSAKMRFTTFACTGSTTRFLPSQR